MATVVYFSFCDEVGHVPLVVGLSIKNASSVVTKVEEEDSCLDKVRIIK